MKKKKGIWQRESALWHCSLLVVARQWSYTAGKYSTLVRRR
jgi:hypothetical protein